MSAYELVQAIVDQGIRDYVYPMTKADQQAHAEAVMEDAADWLYGLSTSPGSFLWCCRNLGIEDPETIRESVEEERADLARVKSDRAARAAIKRIKK